MIVSFYVLETASNEADTDTEYKKNTNKNINKKRLQIYKASWVKLSTWCIQ